MKHLASSAVKGEILNAAFPHNGVNTFTGLQRTGIGTRSLADTINLIDITKHCITVDKHLEKDHILAYQQ